MTREQLTPALLAALLGQGVAPQTIEDAIRQVRGLQLGEDITDLAFRAGSKGMTVTPFIRSWIFDQARRLENK